MTNLMILLLFIFGGVALIVLVSERFGSNMDAEKIARLSRWIMPLVGLSLVLSLISYYWRG